MPSPESWGVVLGVLGGVGLAAACGFRIFVPLLILSIAARAGAVDVAPGLTWMASTPALIAFSVACAVEITAYYVPWLDHALDTIAAPVAVIAGTVVVASQAGSLDPWLRWVLGVLAGGSAAGLVQGAAMLTRGLSLITTAGAGNWVVSSIETVLAILVAALAVLIPLLAVALVIVGVLLVARMWVRKRGPSLAPRTA